MVRFREWRQGRLIPVAVHPHWVCVQVLKGHVCKECVVESTLQSWVVKSGIKHSIMIDVTSVQVLLNDIAVGLTVFEVRLL